MPKEVTQTNSLDSLPDSASSVSGKMIPISRIVNSSRVSSASDPPLSSGSILIKWRPVSAVSGIGSWEPSSHTILNIPAGGVLVLWLVSLLSEEIKGFIVKGDSVSVSSLSPFLCLQILLDLILISSPLFLLQIPCPLPTSSTSLIPQTLSHSLSHTLFSTLFLSILILSLPINLSLPLRLTLHVSRCELI
jgi:hypothetical protein